MSAPNTGAAVRAEAARVVDAVAVAGRSLDDALASADAALDPADRPLLRMLCYGTLRNHWRLREFIGQLLDKPLKAADSVIESLIALGLFQLVESRIPDHAAVSLTVDAARRLRKPKLASLVNAVLRNFVRRNLAATEPSTPESRFNHPAWFIERLQQDWPSEWPAILSANNARAPMWLRVNRRKMVASDYLQLLDPGVSREGSGETAPPGAPAALLEGLHQAIRLGAPRAVTDLPGFEDGLVSVQDAAAQLAAPWLLGDGLPPGKALRILDACAAPGGKAAHLLELGSPAASLTAVDADSRRLAFVGDNLERLGLSATLVAADASNPEAWWDGERFDRILLDAPCSGTGVIRRHPDIKLLRRKTDIDKSAELQLRLLAALWPLLAPGGRLLYVTCSVLACENDEVVGRFMGGTPEATENIGEHMLPNYNIRDLMHRKARGFQILPGERDLDGFYYACLDKPGRTTG
jgi:16S rRNA (cytosine967-C5)-methyltransferase